MASDIPSRSSQELETLRDVFCTTKIRTGFKTYSGTVLPDTFAKHYEEINDFEVYDDDIWVISFPKCGTTWTQEMVWCIANNVDLEAAKSQEQTARFPFLEYSTLYDFDEDLKKQMPPMTADSINYVKHLKRPRFIKTHLPWDLLPKQIRSFEKKPKIIQVTRNAKDVCISYYHHSRLVNGYSGDFDLFVELFLHDKLVFTPFFGTILGYWNHRSQPHIKIIKYEHMIKDLTSVVKDVAKFLEKPLTYKEIEMLLHHLSFSAMKKNDAVNQKSLENFVKKNNFSVGVNGNFFRTGITGGFKTEMTPTQIELFNKWIEDKLKNSLYTDY